MEIIIAVVVILGTLVLLDVAALKWGNDTSKGQLSGAGYDPRYNWNSPRPFESVNGNQEVWQGTGLDVPAKRLNSRNIISSKLVEIQLSDKTDIIYN